MTLRGIWLRRWLKGRATIKAKLSTWTDTCRCGHPRINHMVVENGIVRESMGIHLAKACPCGCKTFHRAKRKYSALEKRKRDKTSRGLR